MNSMEPIVTNHASLVSVGYPSNTQRYFLEDSIIAHTDEKKLIIDNGLKEIRDNNSAKWLDLGLTNGGLLGLSYFCETSYNGSASELLLRTRETRYFDFLATHVLRISGTAKEKEFIDSIVAKNHNNSLVYGFPNPLSVGLAVFCENGDYLVSTRRSNNVKTGGLLYGGQLYCMRGSSIKEDYQGSYLNKTGLPYITARRGLVEEMGLSNLDISLGKLFIHTFVKDTELMDYKFLGVFITGLSSNEIYAKWESTQNRAEDSSMIFINVNTPEKRRMLIKNINTEQAAWSSVAALAIKNSLNFYGYLQYRNEATK